MGTSGAEFHASSLVNPTSFFSDLLFSSVFVISISIFSISSLVFLSSSSPSPSPSSEGTEGRRLSWDQRISTTIGVAKGIQFLHAGIIPGLFANNLKITNILLDHNQVPKIGSYNIPILSETMKLEGGAGSKYPPDRVPNGDKIDMYDFGVILLEVVSGRPISSIYEVEIMKEQLQSALRAQGPSKRRNLVDPAVSKGCSDDSMRTVMEICLRCLAKEPTQRPSVEDVLWNLQFAAQVQDDSRSSEESPLSPSQLHAQSAED